MRVLHVLAPAPYGGLERVVRSLAVGLARRGHAVDVAAVLEPNGPPERHPFVASLAGTGVAVHPLVVSGRGYLRERAAVAALCRSLGSDVVHTHGYRADVVDSGAARASGVPVATTVHGFTGGGARNRLYEALQRAAFLRFDGVVAVSRPLAERLLRGGVPARRLRLIPNAWDGGARPLPRGEARERLGVAPGAFHVGWAGRLSREKGPDVLLDALARLPDPPVAVSFLGDGREAGALRARAERLGVADRVRWHGAVEGAAALFPGFDAFVLSSRTEGTPMVLFEAVAAGVPVVATRVGGVPDVVGDAEARLVPPEDPAALAAALDDVRRDPDSAARRAEAARARLEARFGADAWLAAYESLYAGLASPPSSSSR
jgi:glycosyltransferase involved in cell wall biosynthesis